MELYSIEFAKSVRKDFKGIPKKDAERILGRIDSLSRDPRPPDSKKLTNEDAYRIRVGSYRVIYEVRDQVLIVLILKLGHRKDIYR